MKGEDYVYVDDCMYRHCRCCYCLGIDYEEKVIEHRQQNAFNKGKIL